MSVIDPGFYVWLLPCFAIALTVTWLALGYARRRNLLDHPGERRSHAVATPRGGGIGIVVAMALAIAWLALWQPELGSFYLWADLGLILVAGIGWWDDHRPLSPWLRLCVHAVAAAMLAYASYQGSGSLPVAVAAFGITMVLVNIWNFMDGVDGIAALQALVVAAAYALLSFNGTRWLCLALVVAIAGFLPFNLIRARIFMGDVGSGALGYLLAMLAVMVSATHGVTSLGEMLPVWCVLLLPPSAFLVDATLTLATRMLRSERWWTPHVEHAYQRWVRRGRSHFGVAAAYCGWAVCGSVLALVIREWGCGWGAAFIMLTGMGWYLAGIAAWTWLRRT